MEIFLVNKPVRWPRLENSPIDSVVVNCFAGEFSFTIKFFSVKNKPIFQRIEITTQAILKFRKKKIGALKTLHRIKLSKKLYLEMLMTIAKLKMGFKSSLCAKMFKCKIKGAFDRLYCCYGILLF